MKSVFLRMGVSCGRSASRVVSFDYYIAALEQRVTSGGIIYWVGVAMAFDYKKEYKEFYLPPKKPSIVEVPKMTFLAVRGHGDLNEEGGAYKDAPD